MKRTRTALLAGALLLGTLGVAGPASAAAWKPRP